MNIVDITLPVVAMLLFVTLALQLVLMRRTSRLNALDPREALDQLEKLEKAHERTERLVNSTAAQSRDELGKEIRAQRLELATAFKGFSDSVGQRFRELAADTTTQLGAFSARFGSFAQTSGDQLDRFRAESAAAAQTSREELTTSMLTTIKELSETLATSIGQLAGGQKLQLDRFSSQLESFESRTNERSDAVRTELAAAQKQHRESVVAAIAKLEESNEKKLEAVRATVEVKLQSLRDDNAKQLEQMRQTVDEKLQSTLEKRLGESFKLVSDRLELVHRGLGEMQSLATGVGDLKKVLTNVKARGTWGEVQLGALLEQVLHADQFGSNVATKDGGERVEFAIRLPGQGPNKDDIVWLPIDAKFPIEDYQRLVDAQERADIDAMDAAGKQLEMRVKANAADISRKYLNPPKTTDFAILFLPIEGLFAEVARRTALIETIQREHRVMIAGPTTLWSILNSLQMGFRTLAIQERSSEVWNLLAAVKTEWSKYGAVLAKVQKKLHQASETLDAVDVRSRAVGRKLKAVQELPATEAAALLPMDGADLDDESFDGDDDPASESSPLATLRH